MKRTILDCSAALMLALVVTGVSASNAPGPVSIRADLPGDPTVTGTATIGDVGDCSRVDINVTGDVTGTNDLGGGSDQVRVSVWDDGVEEDFEIVSVPVGDTVTIDVDLSFLGEVGAGAQGVGVFIFDGPDADFGATLFQLDPFDPDEVPGTCGTPTTVSIPVDSFWAMSALILLLMAFGLQSVWGLRRS